MSNTNLSDYVNEIKGKVGEIERDMNDWRKCLDESKEEIEKQIDIIDREVISKIKDYKNSFSPFSEIKEILEKMPTE
ncbi:hypothetical protein BWK69_00680 [Candidatus Parcubacteria bacterium A4]|nr:MAG: hypothetical protein BWK69_00680 [Candidatus Parcubacteria bacterium A4]